MDGKYFKPDSDFQLKKCARRCHGGVNRISQLSAEIGVDRISKLPDEMIIAILSFLSLREAVTTSVLSTRFSDLWKHTPSLKFDRISQLPDEIIIFILSFLSLRDAATTSVLSSRWSDLWKHTPNLNFNTKLLKINPRDEIRMQGRSWDVERCKYIEMVNSVLQSHKALSLKKFRISLFVNKSAHCTVIKWLEFVFSRQVEKLELDFICKDGMYMVALEQLLRDSSMCRPQPQTLIFCKSLKRLSLKCVKVSGEAIKLFLRNCPLLEQLMIHGALLTSDVEVCGTTLMLKHLLIYCRGENSIKISAPNLTWLTVHNTSDKLLLENVPKLIGAEFSCRSQSVDDAQHFAASIFCCMSHLESLSLTLHYPEEYLANRFPEMPKLKKLVLAYFGVYKHGLLPVTSLIWAAPCLQEFELQFISISRDLTALREGITNAERYPHRHLKVFEFRGFHAGADDHIELVTYIVDNCIALRKMFLGCSPMYRSPYSWQEESELIAKQQASWAYAKQQLRDGYSFSLMAFFPLDLS